MLTGDPDREGYAISCHIYEEVKSVAKDVCAFQLQTQRCAHLPPGNRPLLSTLEGIKVTQGSY